MKYPRTIISNCPICNSPLTGYYLLKTADNDIKRRLLYLKKGQRISIISDIRTPYNNCFCVECGSVWHDSLKCKWVTKEIWEEYVKEHYFVEEMQECYKKNQRKKHTDNYKKEKIQERNKVILSVLLKFGLGISPNRVKKNMEYYKGMKQINKERREILKEEYGREIDE